MIGDNLDDDIAGALACGLRAVLVDRGDRHPGYDGERMRGLGELPDLLGLEPALRAQGRAAGPPRRA